MASWFLVGCREVSGFPSKSCFRHAFDSVGTAPEKVADRPVVIQWVEPCVPPVSWWLLPRGGRSVKVAVYVGGFRHGRESIFFPPACWRYYHCFNTDRQNTAKHASASGNPPDKPDENAGARRIEDAEKTVRVLPNYEESKWRTPLGLGSAECRT
ncbi:hypothetical protein NDU88_004590 [Pleurodeles waltl]|uniref:Uncharacterized protein n=1 Tax=Pleurodeles waltl TaxID=8319 RepID=A0AAV7WWC0_PLEWA|nr:hypothetical protein NDU88_004590 [Pleurodeles waltl]